MEHEAMQATVAAGAALLDERYPGWAGRVDLSQLDMRYPRHCVLSHVYGEYHTGLRELFGSFQSDTESNDAAKRHGFDLLLWGAWGEWGDLEYLWRVEIQARIGERD